ncbi:MAG TPA: DNA-formamidopyrimidine glycosylase family protein [Pseudobacteroides sp.]|uniref:DNA-formamidopyrimidine glycosylase family protein n=1 Tax=Pseudobacteroides sp. TaxID=1968840 RepID=UPI002F94FD99
MIELPEALAMAQQINETVLNKKILNVTAAHTPHKFAWFYGDPQNYNRLLSGKKIGKAAGYGSMIEIQVEDSIILLHEGLGMRYHSENEEKPKKHQLLIEFEDATAISVSVQMYAGIGCFKAGELDNKYYKLAKDKPSPLSDEFDKDYFDSLVNAPDVQKLSIKAFLATEQRIPGLGNGVLQDILYNAKAHPKKKVRDLSKEDKDNIFSSVKSTLAEMTFQGGRDTEKDLFGCLGGYKTKLSKNTSGNTCELCSGIIVKENYMGGSIYFCTGCQLL